jgi:hypothetical protein
MSLNMINLNEMLSFFSLYLASFVYNLIKLANSRSYSDDLIDWFTDVNDEETNNRNEIDDEYLCDKDRDETSDEYFCETSDDL